MDSKQLKALLAQLRPDQYLVLGLASAEYTHDPEILRAVISE